MTNYNLADFISRLNYASQNRYLSIKVSKTLLNIKLLHLFFLNGLISGFRIFNDYIWVFLSYSFGHFCAFSKLEIISKPGHRVYWSLLKLNKKYNNSNFSGFFILSSNQGLITSNQAILSKHISGEVLLKVSI